MSIRKCYKIIINKVQFLEFVNFLPSLQDGEKFYCALFARNKYMEGTPSKVNKKLAAFLTDKEHIIDDVTKLEVPVGCYKLRDGNPAPQESLAIYIQVNPRSITKASTEKLGKKCWDLQKNVGYNLLEKTMSIIQTTPSRKMYLDVDIDTKDVDLKKLKNVFPSTSCYTVVETRGGYHILVDTKGATSLIKEHNKVGPHFDSNWYGKLQAYFPIDEIESEEDERMLPIPGCTQGGFVPKIIEI